ncbi:Aspergillopepsin-2 [Cytospora mali]|uniref:Aspergillopepsin-2 n=1 Tax=Cytospora mali TaxID=578113 RepID=A0A194VGN9_CYTMA|nr:Aspergillopepsin-2 [Valsa mali var. pyri (nom. inval.)]
MKSFVVLSTLLAVALAAPSPNAVARSIARRRGMNAHRKTTSHSANDEYDTNWAGAVVTGENITEAYGSFKVLTANIPTKQEAGENSYTASAWVGMSGYSDCSGLWQAGVDSIIEASGDTSFYAWYEWYPADTQVIDIGTISAGDVINVKVSSSSSTEGSVVLENQTTGKSFSKTVTSSDELCGTDAEWILEDVTFEDDSDGLANFTSVTFSDISMIEGGSTTTSLSNAIIMDIEDDKKNILTSSTITDGTVVVTYV